MENNKENLPVGEEKDVNVENASENKDTVVKKSKKHLATAYVVKIALLTALSVVLYMWARFPIFPMFPFNVLDMDFSSVPSLIGGFALGPVACVIIEFIKCTIKLSTTTTAFVGELSNFIVSVSFVLPASLFYKYNKTKKGALIALVIGTLCNAVVSMLNNYFITVPLYANLYLPAIMEYRVAFAFEYGLAFNLIKSVSTSIITFLLYKRLSKILHI